MDADERMNQMASRSTCKPVLLQKIDASMLALDAVRLVLHGGDMGRINRVMAVFQEAFDGVRQYVETSVEASETPLAEEEVAQFRQMEIMHRKVLRSITARMGKLQEDILVIEGAQSRLHRSAELVRRSYDGWATR